ncbi:MAG: hypothetical protein JNG84_06750 [Archangium sp.]|nr:hypothetical protein [Archangium sp.]
MSKERAAQLVDAGIWLKLSGDLEGARKLFQRALKLDPTNEQAQRLVDAPAEPSPTAPGAGANPFEVGGVPQVPPVEGDWGRQAAGDVTDPDGEAPGESTSRFGEEPQPEPVDWGAMTGSTPMSDRAAVPESRPSGLTIVIGDNDADAPEPIRSTPPIFAGADEAHSAVTSQVSAYVPRSTPSQFEQGTLAEAAARATTSQVPAFQPPVPPPAPDPALEVVLEASASASAKDAETTVDEEPPVSELSTAPPQHDSSAWDWGSTATTSVDATKIPGEAAPWPSDAPAPEPRASPALAPHAESAWDAKSNPGIKLNALLGEARALELIETNKPVLSSPSSVGPRGEVKALLRGARDLLDLDDHSGAMELILKAQAIAPEDPDVEAMRAKSEKTLLAMFESKLGNLAAIPRVLLKDDEIIWLNLDHRAGFVLAQIDGTVSFDDLFAVSGMSRLDTARIIAQLIDEGVIAGR